MEKSCVLTADGSSTLYAPAYGDHYHSLGGALQESMHIYIHSGFDVISAQRNEISILEIGFGTGLNAMCTLNEAITRSVSVKYTGIEPYPLDQELVHELNYPSFFTYPEMQTFFTRMHEVNGKSNIHSLFELSMFQMPFQDVILPINTFDLVYYDPFKPSTHADLWTAEMFAKTFASMTVGGILLTYSTGGSVRRNMQEAGFIVEKIAGPGKKREITRATRPEMNSFLSNEVNSF